MRTRVSLLALALLAAGCSSSAPTQGSFEQTLKNPLAAERYWTELTETYVHMLLADKNVTNNPRKVADITKRKEDALAESKRLTAMRRTGIIGSFVPVKQTVTGITLLLGHQLFFDTEFYAEAGPNVHVYLSEAIDPRDVSFPDDSRIDLGQLQSPYGAQTYAVPKKTIDSKIRSVVLYDQDIGRIFGFAQLSAQP